MANILVAIPTNGSNGREEISGVFDYANRHTDWAVHVINTRTDIVDGVLQEALKNSDGLILDMAYGISWLADKLIAENPRLKIVVSNDHLVPLFARYPCCRTLLIDSISVGRDAALYFNSLGRFASYGFVHGAIRYPWSIEREEGFRLSLSHKTPLFVFPPDEMSVNAPNNASTPVIPHVELRKWLDGLVKPAAVFCANDQVAREVLAVCAQAGIKVPRHLSVVGCDNDPLVWENTQPPLSSFQLPFHELGFNAAQTLDRLLRGGKPPQRTIRIAGTHLFERGSTARVPPATALVENAREYIVKHACEGIRVDDVAVHLGVSRRLLDLRFRQVCGKSVLEDILDVRLAEVKRMLNDTDRTIIQIGRDCGFNDPDNLKRLFRKRFGTSMREWRAASPVY